MDLQRARHHPPRAARLCHAEPHRRCVQHVGDDRRLAPSQRARTGRPDSRSGPDPLLALGASPRGLPGDRGGVDSDRARAVGDSGRPHAGPRTLLVAKAIRRRSRRLFDGHPGSLGLGVRTAGPRRERRPAARFVAPRPHGPRPQQVCDRHHRHSPVGRDRGHPAHDDARHVAVGPRCRPSVAGRSGQPPRGARLTGRARAGRASGRLRT